MTTPMKGPSLNPATLQIWPEQLPINVPGGVAGYDTAATNVGAILSQAHDDAVDQIRSYIATPDNAVPGSRFERDCSASGPYGGQPERADFFEGTERTDVFFDYKMLTQPSNAAGYAIDDDGWIPI